MIKKKKDKSNYTIMFIPDDNGKTFYFKLNRFFIRSIFLFLFILSISAIFYTVYWARFSLKVQLVDTLENENRELKKENKKLYLIINKLKRVENNGEYLRRLASTIGSKDVGIDIPQFSNNDNKIEENFISDIINKTSENANQVNISASIPSISPVDGWISKKFGESLDNNKFDHNGVDFVAKEGSLIRSTAPGIVLEVANDKYFGLLVTIDHQNGFVTKYGHCKQILVTKGDNIKRGQSIALLGNTGLSSAPHVHYEVIKDGESVDPLQYIFDRLD